MYLNTVFKYNVFKYCPALTVNQSKTTACIYIIYSETSTKNYLLALLFTPRQLFSRTLLRDNEVFFL